METDHPISREVPSTDRGASITDYILVVTGPLPTGLIAEIRTRFAPADIRSDSNGVEIETGATDQAALRALLSLIWDVGAELRSISQATDAEHAAPTIERTSP